MRIVVVTGISGAGKTCALKCFEDMGYPCVDHMPAALMKSYIDLRTVQGCAAFGVDVRMKDDLSTIRGTFDQIRKAGHSIDILFLDADDDTIIHRYQESRRDHPLAQDQASLAACIAEERRLLSFMRDEATLCLDTSRMKTAQMKEKLFSCYGLGGYTQSCRFKLVSFGYKYGIPTDADLVLDARFVTNPFYVPELKKLCGLDKPVSDFVLGFEESQIFLKQIAHLLLTLYPWYRAEGKSRLLVAIGCTGGMHRSVALTVALQEILREAGIEASIEHRNLHQESSRFDQ